MEHHYHVLAKLASSCFSQTEINHVIRNYCNTKRLKLDWTVNTNGSITFYHGSHKVIKRLNSNVNRYITH